ncbi:DUF362 domain-containing protein [Patescibacteria group bacterium]
MDKVSTTQVEDNLNQSINEAVSGVGGFSKYVQSGDVVMLKPNFNTADPSPASTDINFLKAVVELCYENDAKLVMIAESSTMTINSRKVMEQVGVFELLEMNPPPRIYVFEEHEWVKKEITDAHSLKKVSIPKLLERPDKLIYLPCLKTHKYAEFTGALKLSVGLMKPNQRVKLHMNDLQEKIAELNTLVHPDLVIMDGRKCFINEGPSNGDVEEPNLILASESRVAIDIEGVKIIQRYKGNSLKDIVPEELPQIKKAIENNVK